MTPQVPTQVPMTEKAIINELWTNPNFPSAYSGNLKKYILEKESLSRHKNKYHVFKRRKVFVGGPFTLLQADTIHYRDYAFHNKNYKYILVVIDCFSRKNWCRAQKTATAKETAANLDEIIATMPFTPRQFASDAGSEFHSKNKAIFDILIEKYGMVMYTLTAPKKASICERFIRSLKSRIERYFTENNTLRWYDILDKFSNNLNNTIHQTTGVAPNKVTLENRKKIYNKLYGSTSPPVHCRFGLGDVVRLPETKNIFGKGYKANWTKSLFKIVKVKNNREVCFYKVQDSDGDPISGFFYEQELNLVIKHGTSTSQH